MNETPRARLVAYSVAVLAPAVSLLARWSLCAVLGDAVPHMTFFPAVMIAAYYGGFWPGLLATIVSAVTANFFLTEQLPSFQAKNVSDVAGLILFVLVGTIISGLCESLHRARRRIVADERRRAEEALGESEQRFRAFVDHATDAFFLQDERHVILDVNRRACECLGYTRDELLGMTPTDFDPDVTPADLEDIKRKLAAGEMMAFECRHRRKDGTIFPVEIRGQAFWEGGRRFTVALVRDITDRKRAEEALRESERRWRGLTEALPQLVWSAAPDGTCDYFSTQWTEHTGVSEEDLLGWRWLAVLHPDDRERTRHFWLDSVAGRGPYDVEYRVRRSDGVYCWFKTRGTPIRDDVGDIVKWFGSCTDITGLRQTEEALRAAKETAEAANRAKDEFLANVSHEIRTPMNAILGMTELALDTPLTDDQRQNLRTVKSAADNLLGIINDLLDFSKIEAGKLELDPADFSLRTALGDTLRALAVRAHRKGLELVCQVQPDVPDALIGDAGRLRQILLNLVGNAIKFTDDGEVVVTVSRQKAEGSRQPKQGEDCLVPSAFCLLNFEVRDTGIGIPQDRQVQIFRAFEQEDTSTTRKYGGTGLGLTIAARLVALMGGQINVESERGRGSTFAFRARFGRQPHPPEPVILRPPVQLHNLPVLVVDDNATNRRILEEWLRGWQMKPVAVGDGVAAMDALWHGTACGRPYSVVLLDARMPDVDGLALATQIRQRAELSATHIILLTSGDRPGDVARFREQRVNAHLLKPVQQDELLETIYRVMSRTAAVARAPRGAEPSTEHSSLATDHWPPTTALRILVAEDNEFNAQLLEQLLVRHGHRVRPANNGREALSLLGISSQESGVRSQQADANASLTPDSCPLTPDFDLLLLDVHMPELDGFQVIQAIRERERSAGGHLPVIALTARSRQEDRERCLAAGMDDFLAKPIQAADLWVAIDRVVDARRPTDLGGPGLLDPRVLLAACGGDAVILEKICQAFRARLPEHLTAVLDALRERDPLRLREAAHKLCGMVAAFSTVAGGVASDLEDYAAQGQLEEARPLVGQLETMAGELVRLASGLSLETLQQQTWLAEDPDRTANP
jgi:two-component system sensor histidine kinase/response regulator